MAEDQDRRRIAEMIRHYRERAGLSVAAAARKAGIDRGTWTSAETGTRDTQGTHLVAIERALDLPAGAFRSGATAVVRRERELDAAERRIVTATNVEFGEMLLEVMAVPTMTKAAVARWLVDALDMRDAYRAEQQADGEALGA
ncbi:helix-turn-helix domain-containing protein [Saccharothrix sp. HUAS TT1]|uniref:helix-turn-helix domain-containing protein n=1 Tax=unclassified Saccharothrix TaxID=2593673 RepID=UPI00345C33DB